MKQPSLKQPSKRWGIVVGVDEYANAGGYLRNLKGCVADANTMFRTMTDKECCGFDADHVKLLENPTYAEIESAFEDLGSKMARGDELWFYYAGHGYSERRRNGSVSGYLLPSDVRLNENGKLSTHGCISHNGLRDDLIARNLVQGNITVVLFLDCCCAASVGLTDGSRSASTDVKEITDGFTESFRDLGLATPEEGESWDFKYISFMATDKSGKAKEDASGGLFTKCLIEGLSGGRPEFQTVGGDSDCYVRVGKLGAFLGQYVPNQPPIQDFHDVMYPLSVSSERKSLLEQKKAMDRKVSTWLFKMRDENLIPKDVRQFAEDVVEDTDSGDFKYAGLLRNLMRFFSYPERELPGGLNEGATLIRAFYELKNFHDGKTVGAAPSAGNSRSPSRASAADVPLTVREKKVLEFVEDRLRKADGEGIDLSSVRVMTQHEAADRIYAIARERMRKMCRKRRCDPLCTKNERDLWAVKAREGFSSSIEAAVYELICDDAALTGM